MRMFGGGGRGGTVGRERFARGWRAGKEEQSKAAGGGGGWRRMTIEKEKKRGCEKEQREIGESVAGRKRERIYGDLREAQQASKGGRKASGGTPE